MYAVITSNLRYTLVHTDVVEVKGEDRKCPNLKHREFKCNCCGTRWIESITSPLIIGDDVARNMGKYYDNAITCKGEKLC